MQADPQSKRSFLGILVSCAILGLGYTLVSALVTLLLGPMSRRRLTPLSG